jgi:sugar phosphate isomerase/epimerase
MPTLLENETLAESAALCRELGLSFVEINMNLPQYQIQTLDVGYLKQVTAEYGVGFTIHLDENMNIADFNPYVADSYIRTTVETIELAKKLEMPVLNMHMPLGVYFTLPEGKVYLLERYQDQYRARAEQFRDACAAVIGDSGVKICVENWSGYTPWQVPVLDCLLESPAFGLTFDVGHNFCKQGMDEPVILQRREKLCHMHLHDVRDGCRDHQALGTGDLDIAKCLALAEECATTVVVETKTVAGLRASAEWMKQKDLL